MSDAATAPLRVHRLTRLPDAFWHGVRETPWRYDLFQLLRRIDAQGGERYPLGHAPLPKFEPLRIGQAAVDEFCAVDAGSGTPARRKRAA